MTAPLGFAVLHAFAAFASLLWALAQLADRDLGGFAIGLALWVLNSLCAAADVSVILDERVTP